MKAKIHLAPPQPLATIDDVTAAVWHMQLEAGWSPDDIAEWRRALSLARQVLIAGGEYEALSERDALFETCICAVEFVESESLLARIIESFIDAGWTTEQEVACFLQA